MKYGHPIAKFEKAEEQLSWLFTASTETEYQELIRETLKDFNQDELTELIHWLMSSARLKLEIGQEVVTYLHKNRLCNSSMLPAPKPG